MEKPAHLDESLPVEQRVNDLISRLTVEQKVSQLCNTAQDIPELGIPEYNWWNEALHGVARAGTATVFPQAIAMAATFNKHTVYSIAETIAEEGRAKFNLAQSQEDYGIYKGLTFWSPNINIFRDPRWGRGHETYGEDPYLTGTLGTAFIRGLQQTDGKHLKAAACAKHFAAHSGPEQGRHGFNATVSKRDLSETYLPAFKRCVQHGSVEAVMGAYNRLNGVPCCADGTLLNDLLRDQWGFEGHVVSDCGAITDIHRGHGVTETMTQSAALALINGCDLCCGYDFAYLMEAYEEDLITEADIDKALLRTMSVRFRLGMFDTPASVSYNAIMPEKIACPEHKALSLEASRQSLVLLKNNGILPLDVSQYSRIAVIGPNADNENALLGNYNGTPTDSVTPYRGICERFGAVAAVDYAQGCALFENEATPQEDSAALLAHAAQLAANADLIVACVGLDATLEGEEGDAFNAFAGGDKLDLELPAIQKTLLETLKSVVKPMIVVVCCGSALNMTWAHANADALVYAWYPGEAGGSAVAQLLAGDYSPSGRLPITIYQSAEDLPAFEDYSMRGRTYRYFRGELLYPFGYGLSYTRFAYSDLRVTPVTGGAQAEVCVENIGPRDATEILQLYIAALVRDEDMPQWQLKQYAAIFLKRGESRQLSVFLPREAFCVSDDEGVFYLPEGGHRVYVGGSQPDARSRMLAGGTVQYADVWLSEV